MTVFKSFIAAMLGAFVACVMALSVMQRGFTGQAQTSPAEPERRAEPVVVKPAVATEPEIPEPQPPAMDPERERLEKENAGLKAQLAEARAKLAAREGALKETQERLEELRRPMFADVLSSALRADLRSGEVVVTGGYRLADGRRLYAFARPVVEKVDGKEMITIAGRYLTVTDDAGKTVGLDNLATNAANTLQHGEVWAAGEEAEVVARLAGVPGTELVPYPVISVRPGHSSTITVGDVQLKVTPTLAPEGDGLGMELRLEQPQG